MPTTRTAFADESLRVRDGLYVLAAVIVADNDFEDVRRALLDLRQRRQDRLHWREESSKRRTVLVSRMRELPHSGVVVIGSGMEPGRQERARRLCIERLLTEMTSQGIMTVVFERRQPGLDARDRVMVAALQRRHSVPAGLRASWQPAGSEPLLWLADIAAGAAALAHAGDDTYWTELSAGFTVRRFAVS